VQLKRPRCALRSHGQPVDPLDRLDAAPRDDAQHQLLRELAERRLVVEALVVERSSWRHGIGTQLMRAVEDWASARGATLSSVDTYVHSPVSMPFYEQGMGYAQRRVTFQKRLPGR